MPTFRGPTSSLILRKSTISAEQSGTYRLSREYGCATSYAGTALGSLAVDSAPIDFTPPIGYSLPVCVQVSRSDGDGGISTFSAEYVGVTTAAYGERYGTAILSYNKSTTSGSGESLVTTQYSGTYAAPTRTKFYISSEGNYVPSASGSGDILVLQSFVNGNPGSAPGFTKTWVITSLNSTQYGSYYIIEATSTYLITG